MRMARDPGNPSIGPSLAQPWWSTVPTLPIAGARQYAPWEAEAVVDPVGFRQATIDRRLRKYGNAA